MNQFLARARTVVAPDGRSWTVRRVILRRIPRFSWRRDRSGVRRDGAGHEPWWSHLDPDPVLDGLDNFLVVLIAIAALAAFIFVVLPVLLFLFDVVVVLLLTLGGIILRVLFRRPWKIVAATNPDIGEKHAWAVVGTRASARAVEDVARQLLFGTDVLDINAGAPIAALSRSMRVPSRRREQCRDRRTSNVSRPT